ncbi:L-threonylcarbamoyladenylate synthase [Candidatus Dependentiae bacterium]
MAKKLYWKNPEDIEVLKELVKENNNVVISSTDTIYGFLANVTRQAWETICNIKEVAQKRPFLILVSQENKIDKLANFVDLAVLPEKTLQFIDACWPGPVTFIFKAKKDAPAFLSSDKGTVAIRCPEHKGLQEILRYFDGLFSTSANKSMEPAPQKFTDISQNILEKVSYIVLDDEDQERVAASTIVDLSVDMSGPDCAKEFPFTIIREGAFSVNKLKELYRNL